MSLIDNKTTFVQDVIRKISQGETDRIDILVAYFNLEGFRAISEALRDKPVRILIGLKFKFGRKHHDVVKPLINLINQTSFLELTELPPSIQKSTTETQAAWRILTAKIKRRLFKDSQIPDQESFQNVSFSSKSEWQVLPSCRDIRLE